MYTADTSYEEFLEREREKYSELNLEDIETLTKRVQANQDIPPVSAKLIVMFLHGSYFNVDKAYDTIVAHYKYRKEVPQVFGRFDPAEAVVKKVFDTITMCELTDFLTGKDERVIFTRFKNSDPQLFDYVQSVRYFFMMMEYLIMTTGTIDGIVLVMDAENMSWRHIAKTPINLMKKIVDFIQEGLPVRLKEVHVINAGSMAMMLFNILKPFLKSHIINLLKMHPETSTDLFDYVPIEIMPMEIGGEGRSHFEYSEKMYNRMLTARDWYLSLA